MKGDFRPHRLIPLWRLVCPALPEQVLIDAVDEAQPPDSSLALENPAVRLLAALRAAGVVVVATTRDEPEHVARAVRGCWPARCVREIDPRPLRRRQEEAAGSPQQLRASPAEEPQPDAPRTSVPAADADPLLRRVSQALLRIFPDASQPSRLEEAFEVFFVRSLGVLSADGNDDAERGVRSLLAVLVTTREPPCMSALEVMGVRGYVPHLPGMGELFEARAHAPGADQARCTVCRHRPFILNA